MMFQKAVKYGALLRLALIGTSGSGKTYSALAIATGLGLPIAFIDTERGSARKYADLFDFDVLELESFSVENFIAAINAAERGGYKVLIIDSLSHAWSGKDGILEFVDMETAKSRAKNAYTSGWRAATPLHNKLVDTILGCKLHVIACMRSKSEYVLEEMNGKKIPRKIGLQPVQREGMEYEFDVMGDLDQDHNLIISKSRCAAIDNKLFPCPGAEFAAILNEWLGGSPAPVAAPNPTPAPVAAPAPAPTPAPEFVPSDSLAKAKADLRKRLVSLNAQGLNGYGDWGKVRTDMIAVLGIDHLDKAREEHLDSILVWHDSLGRWMSSTDVPFPASATPAPAPFDFQAFLAEIDAEMARRKISDTIAESLAARAMDLAEKKNKIITTVLDAVKAYPLKAPSVPDEIVNLHNEVSSRLEMLISLGADGFRSSARMKNSLKNNLGVTQLKKCTDAEKLAAYVIHLQSKIDSANKEAS
ncbi:MAG: ATP-binding protein [Candidatus Cloacimonetes bacterium]|nr:ATP-binding protein [Candidatus Cloacimonadota bacterium]